MAAVAGPAGPAGPSGSAAVTTVTFTGTTTDVSPTNTPAELRVIGTFTKVLATTDLQVVWNGHVQGNGGG